MPQSFTKLNINFDVDGLRKELEKSDLWGELPFRGMPGSPHEEMTDIWVRHKDPTENIKTGDFTDMAEEHDSVWLKDIESVKAICNELMQFLDGERLGGVLITKLPTGKEIKPHIDSGWHAEYYDKYYIPIKNEIGANFYFEDGVISPKPGEVYAFRNDVIHWVKNQSNSDRIAMIVCIKQSKLDKRGSPCLGE